MDLKALKWIAGASLVLVIGVSCDKKKEIPSFDPKMTVLNYLTLFPSQPQSKAEYLREIKRCTTQCAPHEREYARRIVRVLEYTIKNPGQSSLEDGIFEMIPIAEKMETIYKGNYDAEILVAKSLSNLSNTLKIFKRQKLAEKMSARVLKNVQELVQAQPHRWEGYRLLGETLQIGGDESIEVIQAFYHCLTINPGEETCKDNYMAAVENYQADRCTGNDIKDEIRIVAGSVNRTREFRERSPDPRRRYYMANQPMITAEDIDQITKVDDVIQIRLHEVGRERFSRGTKKNIGNRGLLLVGEKLVMAPVIREGIESGKLNVTPGRGRDGNPVVHELSEFCGAVEKPAIPDHLLIKNLE